MTDIQNPLLDFSGLPQFSNITAAHIEPALNKLLTDNRETINTLSQLADYSWENFVAPLELMHDRLDRMWSPVSHLNAVMNTDELRDTYNKCLPTLSAYYTEVGQNAALYKGYKAIFESKAFANYEPAQQKIIRDALRDFDLAGVSLPDKAKQRFKSIKQRLSELKTQFENNILDATQAWQKHVTDKELLTGLPDSAIALAAQTAQQKQLSGWVFTLDIPAYLAVMTYADARTLREEMYRAFVTRASDQGPHAGQWDNSDAMQEILALRLELANIVGFNSYAEYSLASKMADSPDQVMTFLHDLATRSKAHAEQDLLDLQQFANSELQLTPLEAWDIMYVSEKLRQSRYAISQEQLKPYFPAPGVINGMFEVVRKLYGIHIKLVESVDVWHKDVSFYEITDADNNVRGQFYLDLYAREKKRGGAWMADCIGRMQIDGQVQIPVAFLTCNLTPPIGDEPALFTHQEVITLFHEFGHGLHHMLTRIDYRSVSGINGVAWDAVELPSQFMENWCWEKQALDLFARHYQTNKPLPDELLHKMQSAKNFQAGMQMVRQIEFSLFDFLIHNVTNPATLENTDFIQQTLDKVQRDVAVLIPPEFNRFAHSFAHIFAGGYAAGYYSYKWAEVLSADAFAKFEDVATSSAAQHDILDDKTGAEFLHNILEQGGSQDALALFINFRGRKPEIDALLKHNGLQQSRT